MLSVLLRLLLMMTATQTTTKAKKNGPTCKHDGRKEAAQTRTDVTKNDVAKAHNYFRCFSSAVYLSYLLAGRSPNDLDPISDNSSIYTAVSSIMVENQIVLLFFCL